MEKEIVEGKIGTVGKYDVAYKDGVVKAEISASQGPLKISASAELDAISVANVGLDIIKEKIPGKLDDVLIDEIKALLAAQK